ncbi:hypothetical protein [Alteromonas sp. KUL49]|uniref:hypothetical protein n=1 Tax=Alteromonas sp. KUL49 TaxID=2480798 RepID=UPI00102EE641|nr:hypothetical protein [Alteromonas sp. KUL49]TAP42168.1 hypothetical protein EYS00_00630 [Alteromonas sp. KUL49]GEA09752.1 hypothetical protein KUL49_01270 [Alteromonas sp. KUL49]
MKYAVFGVLLFALTTISVAQTSDRYAIAVSEIGNALTQPPAPEGQYNRFLSTLDNIDVVFMPPTRVEVEFPKGYLNCIFPASRETMQEKHTLLESHPLEVTSAYVFTIGEQPQAGLNTESRIAIRRGFTFGGIRQSLPAEYIELDDDVTILQFLTLGRVDAVISYLIDIQGAAERLQIAVPQFQKDRPIHTSREAFVCHDNEVNRSFVEQINQAIREWKMQSQYDLP